MVNDGGTRGTGSWPTAICFFLSYFVAFFLVFVFRLWWFFVSGVFCLWCFLSLVFFVFDLFCIWCLASSVVVFLGRPCGPALLIFVSGDIFVSVFFGLGGPVGQLCCCIWECCLDLFGCWAKMHLDHAFLSTAGVRFSCTIRGSRLLLLPELCSCTAFERQNIEHMVRTNYLLLQVVRTSERNHHVDRLCNLQLNKYSETASWSAADFICSVSVLLFRCSKECTKTVSAHPFSSQSDKGRREDIRRIGLRDSW